MASGQQRSRGFGEEQQKPGRGGGGEQISQRQLGKDQGLGGGGKIGGDISGLMAGSGGMGPMSGSGGGPAGGGSNLGSVGGHGGGGGGGGGAGLSGLGEGAGWDVTMGPRPERRAETKGDRDFEK